MSTLREAMLRTADAVRSLTAPSVWDYRTVKVTIKKRQWSGGEAGAGTLTDTVLTDLPQQYRVSVVSTREIAGSGGRYETGDVKVGPITPSYSNVGGYSGGWTPAQLDPAPTLPATTGTQIVYVLTGSMTGEYRLLSLDTVNAVSYRMVLRKLRTTP